MVNDSSLRVALQATLSLGQFKSNSVVPALAKVLDLHGQSSWFQTAVLSSEAGSGIDLFKNLEKNSFFKEPEPWKIKFFEIYSNVIGARNDKDQIAVLIDNLTQPFIVNTAGLQSAGIRELIKGLERREDLDSLLKEKLKNISLGSDGDISKAIQDLKQFLQ